MQAPDLFIGVVSHAGTRFPQSQGPKGPAHELASRIPNTQVIVNTSDMLDERTTPVTPRLVQASLTRELDAEVAWARYLGQPFRISARARRALRQSKRLMQRVFPPSPQQYRRLLNIEMSHVDLLTQGLSLQAPWILILEDDAASDTPEDASQGIVGLMQQSHPPAFINLSDSFGFDALGINHLMSNAHPQWAGTLPRQVHVSSKPVTNTVCAILYSREFVRVLLKVWMELPLTPILPIDWKLNLALMMLFERGYFADEACWFVEPGPFVQLSMHGGGKV